MPAVHCAKRMMLNLKVCKTTSDGTACSGWAVTAQVMTPNHLMGLMVMPSVGKHCLFTQISMGLLQHGRTLLKQMTLKLCVIMSSHV